MLSRHVPPSSHLRVLLATLGICLGVVGVDADARQAPGAHRFAAPRAAPLKAERAPRPVERAPRAPEAVPAPVEAPREPAAAPPGRPGRLTPDERRALRQQINDAGRDIYPTGRP